ncbi:MAG: hypothetical protein PHQ26_00600 [Bacteroidales bacterium]|nr:hypothetical protein [Bacteroidales bacterium]MDD3166982.1 hypothetical protein [Bacteroidales bacterium]MDD4769963.1 hypothetical protein [Bacteroidales bacterium]
MQKSGHQSGMIWAIVLLAVMNVATLLSIFYHTQTSAQEQSAVVFRSSDTASTNLNGRFYRTHLNLDDQQMELFRSINRSFRYDAKRISLQLEQLRTSMLEEMSKKKSDTIRLDLLSDSIGHLHAELKHSTYRYYLEMQSICNDEQQAKLKDIFRALFTKETTGGLSFERKGPELVERNNH